MSGEDLVVEATALSRYFGRRRRRWAPARGGEEGGHHGGKGGRPGPVLALDAVSLQAFGGEVVAVVGENGAGKTTLLRCIMGALRPTGGKLTALGFVPHQRKNAYLRQVGLVLGGRFALHPELPVRQSFEYLRVIYACPRDEFEARLSVLSKKFDLLPLLAKPARQLSLGQRMRCELAAAVVHQPRLVLLDEPTLGLDHETQLAMRAMVLEYVSETRATVLLTSHYAQDIEALGSRVLLLTCGRLVADLTIAQARQEAANISVMSVTTEPGRLADGFPANTRTRQVGSALEVFAPPHEVAAARERLEGAGLGSPSLAPCSLADALTYLAWQRSARVTAPGPADERARGGGA